MRFRAASAGEEWAGREALARECEAAGLTTQQARVAVRAAGGQGYAEIGAALGLVRAEVRRLALEAAGKLERAWKRSDRLEWYRALLTCLRNGRVADEPWKPTVEPGLVPQRASEYLPPERHFDRLPAARPWGTVAEDLASGGPLQFLQDLGSELDPSTPAVPA